MNDLIKLVNDLTLAIEKNETQKFFRLMNENRNISGRLTVENDLQIMNFAMTYQRPEIFHHMLSKFSPLHRQSVLKYVPFYKCPVPYIYTLIDNGASIDSLNGSSFPGIAAKNLQMMKYFIDRGLDMNLTNKIGENLLNMVLKSSDYFPDEPPSTMDEIVSMLLWYGSDPLNESPYVKYTAFEMACASHASDFLLEQLFLYTFDELDFSKSVHLSTLIRLAEKKLYKTSDVRKSLFEKLLHYKNFDLEDEESREVLLCNLFNMDFQWFQIFVDRFSEIIREIFEDTRITFFVFEVDFCRNFLEKMEFLASRNDIVNCIVNVCENLNSISVCRSAIHYSVGEDDLTRLIFFLIEYGLTCHIEMIHLIYREYGDCVLFRTLLHFVKYEIRYNLYEDSVMTNFITNFNLNVQDFINGIYEHSWERQFMIESELWVDNCLETTLGYIGEKEAIDLLDFFANRKLINCLWRTNNLPKRLYDKLWLMPKVPLLQQLARDAFKQYLVNTMQVTNVKEFFSLADRLPIGVGYRKIITFETKLYNVMPSDDL